MFHSKHSTGGEVVLQIILLTVNLLYKYKNKYLDLLLLWPWVSY